MRRVLLAMLLLALAAGMVFAQDQPAKKMLISINPLGPIFGVYSGSFEMALSPKLSFFVEPSFFNIHFSLLGGLIPEEFKAWTISVGGGVNFFPLSTPAPKGLFVGGGASLGYLYVGVDPDSVSGFLIYPFVQAGYRFIWGWFSMAPSVRIGYELALIDVTILGTGYETYVPGGLGWGVGLGIAIAL